MEKNHYWGYDFFESEMEDIYDEDDYIGRGELRYDNTQGRRVQVALAPALERCGNAKGHAFDQTLILVKADVSCKQLEKQQKPFKAAGWRSDKAKSQGPRWDME